MTAFQTGHIGLNVTNLERSLKFYRDVFDLEVKGQSEEPGERFAFLGYGPQLVVTLWEQSSTGFDKSQSGLHHLSFQLENLAALKAAENRLAQLGVTMVHQGIVAHREGASSGGLFFLDPDGIRLEIYSPEGIEEQSAPSGSAPTCGFF